MLKKSDFLDNSKEQMAHFVQYKDGSEHSFEYFYHKMFKPLQQFARKRVSETFTIDTIVQEAFVNAWQLREQMKDQWHLYNFLKMTIRWECYHFVTDRRSKFHRRFTYLDNIEDHPEVAVDPEEEREAQAQRNIREENLKLILDAIPYLSGDYKNYLSLYVKYGLNHKKIAARYGAKYQAVIGKVQHGIELLKQMIVGTQLKVERPVTFDDEKYLHFLDFKSAEVYKLRTRLQYDFHEIGNELLLPVAEVIQKYSNSVYLIKKLKNEQPAKHRFRHPKDPVDSRLPY